MKMVALRLPVEMIAGLKDKAWRETVRRRERISFADVVREAANRYLSEEEASQREPVETGS